MAVKPRVDPEVSEIFRRMGRLGGPARAKKYSHEELRAIARKGVQTRLRRMKEAGAK